MNLTFRQIKIFESVARNLNFTKAARELYLSQPAVSMQVKLLEEQIGMPLMERLGRYIRLTEAGHEMYAYAKNILQQQAEIEVLLDRLKGLHKGHLEIAVATTANHFTIQLLAGFTEQYNEITFNLNVTNRESLLKLLHRNAVDFVIMGKPPKNVHLEAEIFMENPLVVIAHPKHPLLQQKNISLKSFSKQTLVARELGSGTRSAIERFFYSHEVEFNPKLSMTSNEAIKHAVEAGLGLGIVSLHTLFLELKAKSLAILQVKGFPIIRDWYVVQRKGKKLSIAAEAFKQYIIQESSNIMQKLRN